MMLRIVFLATVFVIVSPTRSQEPEAFTVELLSSEEVKSAVEAEKDLAAAQLKHDAALNQIRYRHGQSINPVWGPMCDSLQVSVEIRGKYALVTRTKMGSCIVPAGGR
jgi:hypothetical protein